MVPLGENNFVHQNIDDGMSNKKNSLKTFHFWRPTIVSTLADYSMNKMDDSALKSENILKEFNFGSIEV